MAARLTVHDIQLGYGGAPAVDGVTLEIPDARNAQRGVQPECAGRGVPRHGPAAGRADRAVGKSGTRTAPNWLITTVMTTLATLGIVGCCRRRDLHA
ncbi:hypothetical protein [Jidongwangia harbinensis]|uniref:hypothetical protein n=1 Tax=Jidongwangia harbinensis TaxID=2878561 RepID=UPI001CD95758|nr:hypothetical protein [Jidongwangia harbinensis]MCA2211712.1 hypothetical protein [Jidongwangia harbinensis]